MRTTRISLPLLAVLAAALGAPGWPQGETLAIRAGRILTMAGDPIEGGVVVIRDGKIVSVTAGLDAPEGARVIDASSSVVMPGMVDANARFGILGDENEQSEEITPEFSIAPCIDLASLTMQQAAQLGVTTIRVAPGTQNVVCGSGALVKTAGGPLGAVLLGPSREVKVVVGDDPGWGNSAPRNVKPNSFYYRQPTTRMGVVWLLRQALDRVRHAEGPAAAQSPLGRALAGTQTVHVLVRSAVDIETTFAVADEFGLSDLVFEDCVEAYKMAEPLAQRAIPVIVGPMYGPTRMSWWERTQGKESWSGPGLLARAGVKVAIASNTQGVARSLLEAASLAARNGMPPDEALMAVTRWPSEILGLADRVGTLEAGKDADLVILNGPPLAATTRIEKVLVGGRMVLDTEMGADADG